MLPSSSIDCRSSSISSSSISSSSSSSNSSFSLLPQNPKTMEEVWKDITITSLPNTPINPHPTPTSSHHFRGMILQDFFNNNNGVEETRFNNNNPSNIRSSNLEFLSPPHNPPENTTTHHQEFQFFDHRNHHFSKQGSSFVSGFQGFNNAGGYDALAPFGGGGGSDGCAGGVAVTNNRKRFSESGGSGGGGGEDEDESVERRHKRMIKNRESAARSRARKQAYITELELEVDHLSKENAMLRKQHRQLIDSPPSHQVPKKYGLHRTSTAPF